MQDCFFEDLHAEDKVSLRVSGLGKTLTCPSAAAQMTVTYQVAGGGHLDIDFWMKGPGEKMMTEHKKRDTGTHSFTADTDGRYTYCFSNEMSTVTGKTVR